MKTIQLIKGAVLAFSILLMSGCALNLVSDYDQESLQSMELLAKKVDLFYAKLAMVSPKERGFKRFNQDYVAIDVDLNALLTRQKIRAVNELTTKQVVIAQNLWSQDMQLHKQRDTISDFIVKRHRQQFNRLFLAMIKGEESKPVSNN